MKKIFKYSLIVALCAGMAAFTGCQEKEFDVNPLTEAFTFSGMAPNPVMRGGELRIFGRKLDEVKEVRFAGDISVTEFVKVGKGAKLDTLYVIVPLEGPEVGKVSIVSKSDEVKTSQADLTFSEPIEISSFSPATVLSGDIITIKGEYLYDVKEVFFSGEDAYVTKFESQDRHELKLKVPANAITGPMILSDVNEVEDGTTIPNHIYTQTDLVVGNPTVNKAAKATYKSGDVITVTGEHLDMIKNVAVPQVASVEFTLAKELNSISFNLPPKATDGNITLTSFAGVEFDAGEIETVNVAELAVVSKADDGRYKAGCTVEISGTDLDLVSAVDFEGAAADWYLNKDVIVATQPAGAKDGQVVVTRESGKKAYSDAIEVVKPVVTAVDTTAATAGKDTIIVSGTDLDLVTSVTIGNKGQSFIDCVFEYNAADSTVAVVVPEQAYNGPITLTAASGYDSATGNISIVYDMSVSIKFDAPSFGLGQKISITGTNLMQIERIFIKGKKVTSFAVRTDTAMSFDIPEGLGPGVYRLEITLVDDSELTWPVPFEITAPFTETFFWEGYEDLAGWGNQPFLGADGALADGGVVVGDLIRIYFDPLADWWQFQIFDGHWGGMTFPELDGTNTVTSDIVGPDAKYFAFEVTDENIVALTTVGGWGGVLLTQGEGVAITGLSVIHFGAAEKRTVIWEGSLTVGDWDGSMGTLSWGGYDWSTVQAGTKLAVSFTASADNAVMRFGNGSWTSMPSLAGLAEDGNIPVAGLSSYEFELTEADLEQLTTAGGLVICGAFWTLTEVALVTVESAGPQEKAIWEGEVTIGDWDGSMGDLSWGGYDWSTVTAGTKLVAHFTTSSETAVMRFGNGSWTSMPSLAGLAEDGNIPIAGLTSYEFELTEADLEQLNTAGGLVICGAFFTITSVGLL